jgi:hypothetical protein
LSNKLNDMDKHFKDFVQDFNTGLNNAIAVERDSVIVEENIVNVYNKNKDKTLMSANPYSSTKFLSSVIISVS